MLKGFPDLPPVWLLLGLVLAWFLAGWLPLVRLFGPLWQGVGVLLALAGLGVILWAVVVVLAQEDHDRAAPRPRRADRRGGLIAFRRNPIYLGDAGDPDRGGPCGMAR